MPSKCLSLPQAEALYVKNTARRTGLPYAGVVRQALTKIHRPMPSGRESWRFTVRLPEGSVSQTQIVAAIREQMVEDAASGLVNELGLGQEQHQTITDYLKDWFSPANGNGASLKGSVEQERDT